MEWTRAAISPATVDWLAALSERRVLEGVDLVHGSPREPIWEYIVSVPIARANLAALTTPYGLYGHTHLPMVFSERDGQVEQVEPATGSSFSLADRRALVNPGSVGQPRDGITTSSYLVIDTDTESCTWHRAAYDIAAVQGAMTDAGLPRRLVDRLSYGL
jgi:diadenosine tetraphosphatase ApaH/serine/threonine PP2A family protein phosphatase